MPQKLKREMFDSIELRLSSYMPGRIYPTEIATTFNFILYDEFKKKRRDDPWWKFWKRYSLKPTFVGQYMIDKSSPYQTRVYSHQGTEACSPIEIKRGVIGRAIRTGQDQYVPDVTKDYDHVGCDPNMEGSELVLISWSNPYPSGPYTGKEIPLGVLDIDLNVKNVLIEEDIHRVRKIWDTYGKQIFPGSPKFLPKRSRFPVLQIA